MGFTLLMMKIVNLTLFGWDRVRRFVA